MDVRARSVATSFAVHMMALAGALTGAGVPAPKEETAPPSPEARKRQRTGAPLAFSPMNGRRQYHPSRLFWREGGGTRRWDRVLMARASEVTAAERAARFLANAEVTFKRAERAYDKVEERALAELGKAHRTISERRVRRADAARSAAKQALAQAQARFVALSKGMTVG